MKLKPVIQSEVSQKEKHQYSRGDVCGDGASLDCEVDCTNLQNLIKLHQTLDMHSACKTSKI